jgi:hypothetical protein
LSGGWHEVVDAFHTEVANLPTSALLLFMHAGEDDFLEMAQTDYDAGDPSTWLPDAILHDRVRRLIAVVMSEIDRRIPIPLTKSD